MAPCIYISIYMTLLRLRLNFAFSCCYPLFPVSCGEEIGYVLGNSQL